jgi:membrane protein
MTESVTGSDRPAAATARRVAWGRLRATVQHSTALAKRSVSEFRDDRCSQSAAAISYHVLFSVFPMAILSVAILGLVLRQPGVRHDFIADVVRQLPLTGTGRSQVSRLVTSVSNSSVSAVGLVGVAGLLWSASGVMAAVRAALNTAWDTDAHRPFIRGKLMDVAVLLAVAVIVTIGTVVTVAGRLIAGADRVPHWLHAVQWLVTAATGAVGVIIPICLFFVTFLFLYSVVPAVTTQVRTTWPGALVAALGVEALQVGFGVFLAHFAHYNRVYGSLGTIIALLFFVYLASNVFLFGAEVASEYPRLPRRPG